MRKRILTSTLILVLLLVPSFPMIVNISVVDASQPPVDPNTLTIGGLGMPSRADPATAYDTSSGALIMSVYETLIGFARNISEPDPRKQGLTNQFVPRLAKNLPAKEVITIDLNNITLVDESDPWGTKWSGTEGKVHRVTGWRDNNVTQPDNNATLGVGDVVYMEQIDPYTEEWVPCTKFAWQVKLKEYISSTIHLVVRRTWYIFELRQGVKIQPWKFYNGTYAPPTDLTTADVEYSFERAMVQDKLGGPTWMLYKPMLDAMNLDDLLPYIGNNLTEAGKLIDCSFQQNGTHFKINLGIDFPETAWYQILAQTWGCVVPKAFAIDHGCWSGIFFNATEYPIWIYWRRWPTTVRSPLDQAPTKLSPLPGAPNFNWAGHAEPPPILRGTGPYKFTYWHTSPDEWRIDKFDDYWGGWAGKHVNSVIMTSVLDWSTRKNKFLNGDFDTIAVPRRNMSELLEPTPPYDPLPGIVSYKIIPSLACDSMHFQFVVTDGSDYMPTIGEGSQPDFFGNVHARKAFAYALNFTQLLADAWLNEAEQPATWHICGLVPDYRDPSIIKYDIDLDMVRYHLQNANFTCGPLWETGFHITLVYNLGNDQRRIAFEMIESVIESLNDERSDLPPFEIDVVALDWGPLLEEMYAGNLPCFQVGWLADFADADNWVRPYMYTYGDFSYYQGYSNATVDVEIDLAAKTPDGPDRRDLYYDLQHTFINECPTVMTAQPYARYWCRSWVQGWYYNPLATFIPCGDFYNMWKSPPSTTYPWPMFRNNLGRTGYSESPAPATNQTQWNYTTGSSVCSSPAVAYGRVYIGSGDGKVYCLDASTGAPIWDYTTGIVDFSSPAVADGKVYIGSKNPHLVYCLDALTGAQIWNYTTGDWVSYSSPAVADGRVYIGSSDDRIYCLDALTGAQIWNYTTGDRVFSSPAVADGRVYIGSSDDRIYCLDALTGAQIWNYTTGGGMSSPAIADGRVYIGGGDHKVYCLNATTGDHIWNYITGDMVYSSPAVADAKVYIGSYDDNVYCLDALTGACIWNYTTGADVCSSPAVADGKVYVGSRDYKVYCLDASTGARIWSYTTGHIVESSPAVADGVVYVGSLDKKIYAFGNVVMVPEQYSTVAKAIEAAAPGTTIWVEPNYYYESLVINKPLTIIGKPGSSPTFVGGGSGIAFKILSNASGSIIAGIVITNYAQGIFIDGASNCKIYDNIMTLNVNSGIAQGNSAANNLIYSNIFQQNPGVAINLTQYSTGNTIYNNTFILNSIGLNIASSGNTIYWNIFIDNTNQTHVEDPLHHTNTWDNGYPDGGNYWSNHIIVDLCRGPLQNEGGSDGINDTQCTIAANNIDHYPLVKPFSPHDVGITSVTTSKTLIGQGLTLRLDVKILNYGIHNEHFAVAVYANTTIITTFADFALTSRNSTTITIEWNTTGFAKGNYTINVEVPPVVDETDTLDNICIDGTVKIGVPGDLNNDNLCDLLDLVKVAGKFGKVLGEPGYDPNYDINDDTFIDLLDLVKVAIHFGETDP